MDEAYLRQCARYVGLNPVRAGLVARAADWPWSSVRAHLEGRADPLLTPGPLAERLNGEMEPFFDLDVAEDRVLALELALGQRLGLRGAALLAGDEHADQQEARREPPGH